MEYKTIAGNYYTITSKSGCSVTDATGTLSMTVDAGGQLTVQAPSDKLVYDDEQAIVFKANFNHALAVAGLLGGGDKLPAGYTRLEFLKGTGKQYIITDYYQSSSTGAEISADCELLGSGNVTVSACCLVPSDNGSPWAFGLYSSSGKANFSPFGKRDLYYGSIQVLNKRCLFKLKPNSLWIDGVEDTRDRYGNWSTSQLWYTARPLTLFGTPKPDEGWAPEGHVIKAYRFTASVSGKVERDFIPVLDPTGAPCMYDTVTRKAFKNAGSGQFIAGFTLQQAAQLGRKLPSTDGNLTISLPEGYDSNEGVVNSLAQAEAKGWVLTIQTYAAETAAATFAIRRVWVRKEQDENGSYVAADGSRWLVEHCIDVWGADPEALGYERFRSVEAAVEYWELVPYVDPNAEELSTIE